MNGIQLSVLEASGSVVDVISQIYNRYGNGNYFTSGSIVLIPLRGANVVIPVSHTIKTNGISAGMLWTDFKIYGSFVVHETLYRYIRYYRQGLNDPIITLGSDGDINEFRQASCNLLI